MKAVMSYLLLDRKTMVIDKVDHQKFVNHLSSTSNAFFENLLKTSLVGG